MKRSDFLKLNWRDAFNGFLIAFCTASGSTILQIAEAWASQPDFSIDKALVASLIMACKHGALAGGVYILKNLFTKPKTDAQVS